MKKARKSNWAVAVLKENENGAKRPFIVALWEQKTGIITIMSISWELVNYAASTK